MAPRSLHHDIDSPSGHDGYLHGAVAGDYVKETGARQTRHELHAFSDVGPTGHVDSGGDVPALERRAEEIKTEGQQAPDGGWGWVVVAGAFVLNLLIGGAVNSFGVLYVELLDLHKQSASKTAWVGSMANAMGLLLGPLSSALSTRFSCRKMVIVGGVLVAAGWILTGYMPRLEYMFLTYGLLAGVGKSLAYTPSIVMVGQWFDKRRSLANGISVAGAGVGTFAFAPLLELLLDKVGFSHTMLIMGIVMILICLCGALFRPVPENKISDQEKPSSKPESDARGEDNICYEHDNSDSNVRRYDSLPGEENKNYAFKNISIKSDNSSLEDMPPEQTLDKKHLSHLRKVGSANLKNRSLADSEKKTLKSFIDYTLLKHPQFICFGISVMLATLGHSPATVMLPALAQQSHVTNEKAAFLLSIIGIMDIVGRLLFGALCDTSKLKGNRKYLYVASIFISGIANIACTFCTQYWHFVLYAVVFGLFAGSYNALTPVILVDLLGINKLSSSFGLALLFQGLGFLIGPPVGGLVRDRTSSYKSAFYFAGVAMVTSSVVINISSVCKRFVKHSMTTDNFDYKTRNNNIPDQLPVTGISVIDRNGAEIHGCVGTDADATIVHSSHL